jgi:hypothetical protein
MGRLSSNTAFSAAVGFAGARAARELSIASVANRGCMAASPQHGFAALVTPSSRLRPGNWPHRDAQMTLS